MFPRLARIAALPGHRLHLVFTDGVEGCVEVAERLWGPMFEPLRDEALFAQVRVDEHGAPVWPNGADLAPDALHRQLTAELGRGA